MMNVDKVEGAGRGWLVMSRHLDFTAALAEFSRQNRLGRDGVLGPVCSRFIENAAYDADPQLLRNVSAGYSR